MRYFYWFLYLVANPYYKLKLFIISFIKKLFIYFYEQKIIISIKFIFI